MLERVGDARSHPTRRRAIGQTDDERGWQRAHRRVEQRILGVQVATDEFSAGPASTVVEQRQVGPWQRVEEGQDGHALGRGLAADDVPVAVGQDDHVAFGCPMTFIVLGCHPARASGDDVEEDESLRAGVERVREGERRRLEREWFGELGSEEDRARQAKLIEGRIEQWRRRSGQLGHLRCFEFGVSARPVGAVVMVVRSLVAHTRREDIPTKERQ